MEVFHWKDTVFPKINGMQDTGGKEDQLCGKTAGDERARTDRCGSLAGGACPRPPDPSCCSGSWVWVCVLYFSLFFGLYNYEIHTLRGWPKKERGGIGLRDSGGSIMKMDNECSCQSLISIYLLVWGKLLLSFIEVERMREGTSCGKLHVWLLTDVYWLNWKVLVKRIQVEMQKYVFSKHF